MLCYFNVSNDLYHIYSIMYCILNQYFTYGISVVLFQKQERFLLAHSRRSLKKFLMNFVRVLYWSITCWEREDSKLWAAVHTVLPSIFQKFLILQRLRKCNRIRHKTLLKAVSNDNWGELFCNGDKANLIVHAGWLKSCENAETGFMFLSWWYQYKMKTKSCQLHSLFPTVRLIPFSTILGFHQTVPLKGLSRELDWAFDDIKV